MLARALQSGGHALDAGRRMAGSAFSGLAGAGRSSLGYLGGVERGLLQLGRATLEEVAALETRRALMRHSAELPGAYYSLGEPFDERMQDNAGKGPGGGVD